MSAILLSLALMLSHKETDKDKVAIPKGHVTYSIKSDAKDIDNFMGPGAHIDVLGLVKVKEEKSEYMAIVTDGLVVAKSISEEGGTKVCITTVAVKPENAKALTIAEKLGKLVMLIPCPSKPSGE
jgi:hypothetical protein